MGQFVHKTFNGKYRRKLYGEVGKGELYDIKHTSMKEISEHFGLSIGLYFNTLYMCGKFFFAIFIVSSPAVAAFADLQSAQYLTVYQKVPLLDLFSVITAGYQ